MHSGIVMEYLPGLDEVKIKLHYDWYNGCYSSTTTGTAPGCAICVPRSVLHVRKYRITPIVAVSDTGHHDRHFVHHFFQTCWYGERVS
jgi:hypothetical protein